MARVFVSGSFDPLHSGHVAFFEEASCYGDLYVGIGSDESVSAFKHKVFQPQEERLYMVKAIRYVTDANINSGMGFSDFNSNPFFMLSDILFVNEDQASKRKEILCERLGKRYIVSKRIPPKGLPIRTSTQIRNDINDN